MVPKIRESRADATQMFPPRRPKRPPGERKKPRTIKPHRQLVHLLLVTKDDTCFQESNCITITDYPFPYCQSCHRCCTVFSPEIWPKLSMTTSAVCTRLDRGPQINLKLQAGPHKLQIGPDVKTETTDPVHRLHRRSTVTSRREHLQHLWG